MDAIMGGRQGIEGWLGDVRRGSVDNMERATAGHHTSPANDPEEAELDQMIKKERKKTVLLKLRMENEVLQRRAHVPSLPPSTGLPPVADDPRGATPPSLELPPVAGDHLCRVIWSRRGYQEQETNVRTTLDGTV